MERERKNTVTEISYILQQEVSNFFSSFSLSLSLSLSIHLVISIYWLCSMFDFLPVWEIELWRWVRNHVMYCVALSSKLTYSAQSKTKRKSCIFSFINSWNKMYGIDNDKFNLVQSKTYWSCWTFVFIMWIDIFAFVLKRTKMAQSKEGEMRKEKKKQTNNQITNGNFSFWKIHDSNIV